MGPGQDKLGAAVQREVGFCLSGLWVGMGGGAWRRRGLCLFVSRLAGTKGPVVVDRYHRPPYKWYAKRIVGCSKLTGIRRTSRSVLLFVACRLVWTHRTLLSAVGAGAFHHHPAAPASSEARWLETPSGGVEQHRVSVDLSLQVTQTYSHAS